MFLGVAWPAFRRAVIRARSPVEVGEYLAFAGRRFPLKVLDGPTAYQPQELVLQISGPLVLPDVLARAHDHLEDRMKSYQGSHVLFDGSCFVVASPPLVRRSWESIRERPTIVVDLKQTTYFIRVLCRGRWRLSWRSGSPPTGRPTSRRSRSCAGRSCGCPTASRRSCIPAPGSTSASSPTTGWDDRGRSCNAGALVSRRRRVPGAPRFTSPSLRTTRPPRAPSTRT